MAFVTAALIMIALVVGIAYGWVSAIDREEARRNGAHRLTRATAKRIRRGRP